MAKKKNEYTKGPWAVESFKNIKEAKGEGWFDWCSDRKLDDVFKGPVGIVWQETESGNHTGLPGNIEVSLANAHLIAAAPDMFEALDRTLISLLECDFDVYFPDEVKEIRAALAKAKGANNE